MKADVHYVGMRRFLVLLVLALMAGSLFITQKKEKDDTPLPKKLEKVMRTTRMNTYRDPFYGYVVHYPSFFEQVSNPQVKEKGYCQFRFWNVEQIVQTAFVLPNLDSLTVAQGMARFARELHATYQREEGDGFILSGPLHLENREVAGHHFYAKYVQCQKLWFVQILTYPENCTQAMTRLIREIDRWKVWEKKEEKKLPESFDCEPQTTSPYAGPCFPWILITN
ncbi:hypothetical protein [uncultured Bacteroides sp.]|uniref:hypothetical protein n=1 Tax=uncultured Bacteroides sp. TaxID=162156 RepID=UPI00280B8EBB|nr:hypothetical protein [uncultured Bacteroides sp.]